MTWEEVHDVQLNFVRQIMTTFPSWTLDEVLETDTRRLLQVIFKGKKTKKPKREVIPMHEYFSQIK